MKSPRHCSPPPPTWPRLFAVPDAPTSANATAAVFLSYAREDTAAAQRIAETLRAAGVEVWFDQSELRGGDAWDQKIRTQIKECALFLPVISANTQSRHEGYFRLEWRLADQRTHLMGKSRPFLVPVCIDATRDGDADVPDSFLAVQWMRLPNGEANHAFCERVKTLLAPPAVGPVVDRRMVGASLDDARGGGPATPLQKPARTWFIPAIIGVAVIAALAIWQPWRKSGALPVEAKPLAPVEAAATKFVPLSEVQQLVVKIAAIVEKEADATREEWGLAEAMGAQAVKLEPGNAEAWAGYAQAALGLYEFYADRARSPLPDALKRVQQALSLAPASDEVKLALANCYRFRRETQAEAEAILRELMTRHPDDRRVLRALAAVVRTKDSQVDVDSPAAKAVLEEAITFYERAVALPDGDPAAWREMSAVLIDLGRYAEAEAALERSLALRRGPAALVRKISFLLLVRHDVSQACALVETLPGSYFLREGVAEWAALAWLWQGDAARCLRVVNAWNDEFLSYTPKGFLAGQAQQLLQRPDAARLAWREALAVVEKELATTSSGSVMQRSYQLWKVRLLALLGEKKAAEEMLRISEQSITPGSPRGEGLASALVALERHDEALNALTPAVESTLSRTRFDGNNFGLQLRASLRFDPKWNPLRGLPRFEALLAGIKSPIEAAKGGGAAIAPADKSIAVLAFANFGGDKENEYFSDGITEELLNVLAKVPGLRVAARTSAFYFKDKNVPIPEIAKKLNVAYVVEGSVQKSGTRVKITAQLIKASDGFHVWSDTFTRELKDVFAMQDEIAGLIAKQLSLSLGGAPRVAKTVDPEAHRLVLEGRYFWNQRNDEAFKRAEAAFTKAIELDPKYAEAHSGLAGVCVIRELYHQIDGFNSNADDRARAWSEATRAIELDPGLAEPHAVLGYAWQLQHGHLQEAEDEFQKALLLNPNDPVVRDWHGVTLSGQGRIDAALQEYAKAAELDPLWFINLQTYAWDLALAQRFDDALKILKRASALRTEVFIPAHGRIARLLFLLGKKDEAVTEARFVRQNIEIRPRWDADSHAIFVLRQAGLDREANDFAKEVMQRLPVESFARGFVLGALGRIDEALPYLERTPVAMMRSFYWDEIWAPWRENPRFQQLLVKVGLR